MLIGNQFKLSQINSDFTVKVNNKSLFIHEIVSFYVVFLGIVFKNTKTYIMNNKSYNESWCIRKIFPMNWSFKNI